jgi:hypothetical protein
MASALVGLRYFVFGIFVVCNTVLCSVGVWNLSLVQTRSFYNAQISAYMIFLGAFGLLCIFPLIFIDLIRRHPFTSRIWVELTWITIFWIMELSGAAALSAIVPSNHCRRHRGRLGANACLSGQVLLGFAWAITLILLGYMVTLAVYTIVHQVSDPNVWNETVREYPWFGARSTLSSPPPSPSLEKGPGVPTLMHPRPQTAFNPLELARERSPFDDPIEPVPTFDTIPQPSYQPTHRSYDGLHFATMHDPPPIIEPTFTRTREAPKPPVRVHSLYPVHMQAQLSMDARNNLYGQSLQLDGQEPSPIGDWPRKSRKGSRRQPPPPPPSRITAEANALTQQPLPPIPSNQRLRLSGTTTLPTPVSPYKLGSPVRGPQWSNSSRKQPPPPLNLDGISNTSYQARR